MNILKKKASLILMIFIASSFFTVSLAAKEKSDNPFADTEPEINPKTKHPYNLEGVNVIIADYLPVNAKSTNTKSTKDLWDEWTFSTYHMNVYTKHLWNAEQFPQMAMNYCVSGGKDDFVFVVDDRIAALGVKAGLFYDLSTIESVNYYNSRKYNQNTVNKLTRGRSFYAFSWEKTEPLLGVYFNKKMLQEKGYTSEYLYDLQLDKKWNWETFERLCNMITADTDYDGETDVYAMSSDLYDFAVLCLDSNNTALVNRDIEGKYSSNIINSSTMEALNWMIKIWKKHQMPDKKHEGPDYCYKAFAEGKTAFLVGHQDPRIANYDFTAMNDDYGFVCFPLGPNSNGIYKTVSDTKMVVIPACYDKNRAERIAKAIDLWLEPVPGKSNADSWKSNYLPLFRDGRVMDETLVMMNDYPNPRMDVLVPRIDVKAAYRDMLTGVNTPEEEYFYTRIGWSNVFDDYNDYVEKRERLTDDEILSIKEDREQRIHLTTIEKKDDSEEAAAEGNNASEKKTIETNVESAGDDSSGKGGKKAKKKKK